MNDIKENPFYLDKDTDKFKWEIPVPYITEGIVRKSEEAPTAVEDGNAPIKNEWYEHWDDKWK